MAGRSYHSLHEFASAIPNHLLLGSLLEHLCFVYESNPTRSRMLFKGICIRDVLWFKVHVNYLIVIAHDLFRLRQYRYVIVMSFRSDALFLPPVIGQRLAAMNLLSPLAISDEFSTVRFQHNRAFSELLHAAGSSVYPQVNGEISSRTQRLVSTTDLAYLFVFFTNAGTTVSWHEHAQSYIKVG